MQGTPPGLSPYCGAPPAPDQLLVRWNLDPLLIGVLLAVLALYAAGLRRAPGGEGGAARRRAFLAGWTVAALALVSPLCPLSVSLFSARVGQHMVLTLIAAPLLAYGRPLEVIAAAFGRAARPPDRPRPIAAAIAFMALLWLWHAPGPYDATFVGPVVYWEMHVTMIGAAFWLWHELVNRPASLGAAAASAISMIQMGLLGALITLAPRALYAPHALTTWAWGLSPLQDQQLGGAIMWAPGGMAFLVAAGVLGVKALRPRLSPGLRAARA
jgi:putative membrane protein